MNYGKKILDVLATKEFVENIAAHTELPYTKTLKVLKVNILFGPESKGVSEWKSIPSEEFNLVLSPWVGLKTAKLLESKYGTPYLHYPVMPIGANETSKFLLNELGILPGDQYITEDTPEEYQELIINEFKHLSKNISAKVIFEIDGGKISQMLREYYYDGHKPLFLGSSWDIGIANQLNGFWLNIALPVMHRLVLDRSYIGYSGGLRLAEDIYANILQAYK
ncbi:hypothetical protein JMF89_07720 [Clostridiaceae bacterium UIB06]|uniref:Nitrogenase/oxidoreductase component 1 domain-containing protein n=1 Tax=Clostridium thailandense TaxID=2794346 RepID=A0A949WR92_9CLOT|nr:nitrogenase component 1 [Clostridium thailandense]MBV7273696.1 hypothetical protein [Clostridium thailandense]MCH5137088.1 hypothetical protein [Clostridiaceae bacterium UIB06]